MLAERMIQVAGQREPYGMDVLAAAYASAGQFERAVSAAQSALALSTDLEEAQLAERIRRRLERYRQTKTYRAAPTEEQ